MYQFFSISFTVFKSYNQSKMAKNLHKLRHVIVYFTIVMHCLFSNPRHNTGLADPFYTLGSTKHLLLDYYIDGLCLNAKLKFKGPQLTYNK